MTGTRTATLEAAALVALGGFAGSNLRYLVDGFLPGPAGTLLVNALGSFALGALAYEAIQAGDLGDRTHLALGTGVLSSFTTYSTFVVESLGLAPALLAANVAGSYAMGFAGVLAGRAVAGALASGTPDGAGRPAETRGDD